MSEKKGILPHDAPQLLTKKTSRKKKSIMKIDKDIDMKEFKEKMMIEMANTVFKIKSDAAESAEYSSSPNEYERRYNEYLQEGFSLNCVLFINRIIIESTTIPQVLRNHFALHKILIDIAKQLMMNEYELVYFSLYLDKMGWITEGFSLDENLLITGVSVKLYLNANYEFLFKQLTKKKPNIEAQFNKWLDYKKEYDTMMTINPREVNERYKVLSKIYNSYCKPNFIDHNLVVDQILQMSLPYSEGNRHAHEKSVCPSVEESVKNENHLATYFKTENPSNFIPSSLNTKLTQSLGNDQFLFKDQRVENTFSNSQDILRQTKPNIENKPIPQEKNYENMIPYLEKSSSNFFDNQGLFYQKTSQLFNNQEEDQNPHSFFLKNSMSLKNNVFSYTSLPGDNNNSPLTGLPNNPWKNQQDCLKSELPTVKEENETEKTAVFLNNEPTVSKQNEKFSSTNHEQKTAALPKLSLSLSSSETKTLNLLPVLKKLKSGEAMDKK